MHRIIEALTRLAERLPHHLVLVGGQGWAEHNIREALDQSELADRVHRISYAIDDQLKVLFAGASAYVHPPLFEGLGLTILEAMAQRSPVITSNVYSLPEVAGNAALLVDPTSADEIASAIEAVCTDSALVADLIARGKERVGQFSWASCAVKVLGIYRSVV